MNDSKPEVSKIDKNDIAFLIALLTPEERAEIVKTFPETFRQLYEEGVFTRPWLYKLLKGTRKPSVRVLVEACKRDERVLKWVEEHTRERVRRANELLNHR